MTNYKFPLVDDEDNLFDKFPLIILYLTNGDKVELNFFTDYAQNYKPSRYMVDGDFMPKVEYHSHFISPQWTCKEFLRIVEERLKKEKVLQITSNEFIMMNTICKIEIDCDGGDIICFGKGTWNNKVFVTEDKPRRVDECDIILSKKFDSSQMEKIDKKKAVDDFINDLLS